MGDILENLKKFGPTVAIVLVAAVKFGLIEGGPSMPEALKPAPAKPAV